MRETIVKKLNEIDDYPFFSLESQEIAWILKDWIESHTKQKTESIELELDKNTYVPYAQIMMSEENILQPS